MVRTVLWLLLGLGMATWLVILGAVVWVSRGANKALSRIWGR
jgi:hypothetical protein